MDQKKFMCTDKDTKQDFYKTLSAGSDTSNKPQYGPIQPNLKKEHNKNSDRFKDLVQKSRRPIQGEDRTKLFSLQQ